eukprot:15349377-Ditylum_brightwellii.AAC.1
MTRALEKNTDGNGMFVVWIAVLFWRTHFGNRHVELTIQTRLLPTRSKYRDCSNISQPKHKEKRLTHSFFEQHI